MKNEKMTPKIRFKGFTDAWEHRKLSDIADRFDNLRVPITASNRKPGDTPYYGANGIQDYVAGFTHNGEFILVAEDGANDLKNYPVQYVNGKVWVNNHAHVLQGKKTITDNKFLMNAIKNFNIEPFLVGGGRAKLNADVMMKLNILLPTFVEQEKIGSLFSLLDKTIALHQRKLDLLKEQKKGYLQKMFPKNGAKVPELRFAGFADAWEERKLKELGDIQTGNTPPTSDSDNYSLDGVLWVTPTDIKSLVISNTAKKLSQVGVTKARIAKAGSILVTSIASIGKNTLLRMDAGFNQQINSLTPTSENDSYFLLTQSEKWSEKMKQTAASATMQIVNKTDFSNISTYVPVHKEEQQKIGSFFKQLDDIIVLHQRKLEKLQELKKWYLQKMFC